MKNATIVIDVINDFVNGSLPVGQPAIDIIPFIVEQCEKAKNNGDVIIFACDNHIDGIDGKWPKHADPKTDGVKLYGELGKWFDNIRYSEVPPHAFYFPKTKYDAFFGTALAEFLKEYGVTQVTLMGVCTDICIFYTAAGAFFNGFDVKVLKKGCATFAPQNEPQVYEMMKNHFFAEIK